MRTSYRLLSALAALFGVPACHYRVQASCPEAAAPAVVAPSLQPPLVTQKLYLEKDVVGAFVLVGLKAPERSPIVGVLEIAEDGQYRLRVVESGKALRVYEGEWKFKPPNRLSLLDIPRDDRDGGPPVHFELPAEFQVYDDYLYEFTLGQRYVSFY